MSENINSIGASIYYTEQSNRGFNTARRCVECGIVISLEDDAYGHDCEV